MSARPSMRPAGRSPAPTTAGTPIARARIATCDAREPLADTTPTKRSRGTSARVFVDGLTQRARGPIALADARDLLLHQALAAQHHGIGVELGLLFGADVGAQALAEHLYLGLL